jgi:energy-converting hydrogenase A subunit M
LVELLPFGVEVLPIFLVHGDGVLLLLTWVQLESFVESKRIDFLKDSLKSNQGLLENLVPVVISEVTNDWHKHWEGLLLIGLEDVQEVIILKEAHCSISNLEMDSTNASNNSLEQFVDKMFDLVNFTDLKNLLQFGEEESLLDAVSEWPVLKEAF